MSAPVRLRAGEFFGRKEGRTDFACASVSFLGDVGEVELHEHEHTHFVLVTAASFHTDARGADGLAHFGDTIFTPAGTRHRDALTPGGMLMTVTPVASPRANDDGPRLMTPTASARLYDIADEAHDADALSEFVVEGLCLELAALSRRARPDEPPPPWLARAKVRLREACEQDVSMSELAREAGVHPVYFARAFRRHVGDTPGGYQRRCRTARAAHLLAYGRVGLADIALACGFADQAAFTKAFTRAAGAPPGAFRQRWRA